MSQWDKGNIRKVTTGEGEQVMAEVPEYSGVDIEGRVLTFTRTFNYPRALVFAAFTQSDHLRRWWGPEPWGVSDSVMDFRPSGSWHYAMQGPDGTKSWGIMLYKEIDPPFRVVYEDAFADEDGNVDSRLPTATGVWEFTESGDGTADVKMTTEYADEEALKTVLEMGMLEGMSTALKQLEALLAELAK
jgi:uncharacterized protein YndB with AHSA1/START domain